MRLTGGYDKGCFESVAADGVTVERLSRGTLCDSAAVR
jgi:hypothetical protein